MPDENPFLSHQNANNVESVRFAGLTVAAYPHFGRSDQFPAFPPVNGFDGGSEFVARARLHFDEGDGAGPFGDEVYVAVAVAEAALEYTPSLPLKPSLGDSLASDA
jgi:hypothetical protein